MAKSKQRRGVSGNPARRAGATGGAAVSSPDRAKRPMHTYLLGAALVVVTLLVLFVPRPGDEGEQDPSGAAPDVAPPEEPAPSPRPQVEITGPPRESTAEAFCTGFFAMVDEGRRAGEGKARPARLERLADELLAAGVPAAMSLPARTGYYEVISGAYDSLGLELPPEAVGSAPAPLEGANAAFTSYLDQNCPPAGS
ncbi:hypothetical protein GCM10023339_07600 [Alloalcanivorax gelatiniphagus]